MTNLNLPRTMCESVDVTILEAVEAAIAKAEAAYGPTECIVNNAGVMLLGKAQLQDPAEWKTMIDVNIHGVLNGIHAVLKGMCERRHGHIINISSVAGRKTFGDHSVYCGTKFAVHAITEAMREECSVHDVKFTTIAPGVVNTELLGHTTNPAIIEGYQSWRSTLQDGGLSAEDVARSIMFAYQQPPGCCVREIVLAPLRQGP